MKKNSFLIILILLFTFSCNNNSKLEKKMIGVWTVDLDSLQTRDNSWYQITSNGFSIKEDHTGNLPSFFNLGNSENIKWEVTSNDSENTIRFYAPNHPMDGKFFISFYRDPKEKLFKMRLTNGYTTIVCRKGLQNFDRDNPDW